MTEHLFCTLAVYNDVAPHFAAMNMAIDQALLERATTPCIRFFSWQSPALSFGYFAKFAHVVSYAGKRDLVRRWTGGGIVFHGDDLTYSIVIPASDPSFRESSMTIYERVHRALAHAIGARASVAEGVDPGGTVVALQAAVTTKGYNCFANPVHADVMMDGRKIAGAAQRRTHRGLLHQVSIQGIATKTDLAQKFAPALSANCSEFKINEEILKRARELAQGKYGTDSWLRKR
jgi:lipoate-protein ligase A